MATKLIANNDEHRFELWEDQKLIGFSIGADHATHIEGATILKGMAEDMGHTVEVEEGIFDGKQ